MAQSLSRSELRNLAESAGPALKIRCRRQRIRGLRSHAGCRVARYDVLGIARSGDWKCRARRCRRAQASPDCKSPGLHTPYRLVLWTLLRRDDVDSKRVPEPCPPKADTSLVGLPLVRSSG